MANLSKLKRRNTLGVPPPFDEASQNLQAPEIAPVVTAPVVTAPAVLSRVEAVPVRIPVGEPQDDTQPPRDAQYRIDGRSLRRTGRTLQLATRVSWEFDDKLRRIAQRDGLKLVEVLERALEAYEAARK
jgi:hypothetical protein